MLYVVCILTLAAPAATEITPLDAYLLNASSIKVEASYVSRKGKIQHDALLFEEFWKRSPDGLSFSPIEESAGTWATDGKTERFTFDLPQRDPAAPPTGSAERIGPAKKVTLLYDGFNYAYAIENLDIISAASGSKPQFAGFAKGPFTCWGFPFRSALEEFDGVPPLRKKMVIHGQAIELEVYRRAAEPGKQTWYQLEICYAPEMNYLPKYMRRILTHDDGSTSLDERFITKYQKTRSGGFLPEQILELKVHMNGFEKRVPDYSPMADIHLPFTVACWLYDLSNIVEIAQPVGIARQGKSIVSTPGGIVSLSGASKAVDLKTIDAAAGDKLSVPIDTLPNLDEDELQEYQRKPAKAGAVRIGLIATAIASLVLLLWLRVKAKRVISTAILSVLLATGSVACGPAQPSTKLNVKFDKESLIFEPNGRGGPSHLVIRNEGTVPVTIRKVDAGCTCRQIDHTRLPHSLGVGETFLLPVEFRLDGTIYDPKQYRITLFTDEGAIIAPVSLLAFQRHRLEPGYISRGSLVESEPWSFNVTHREIYETSNSESRPQCRLKAGPEFDCKLVSEKRGRVKKSNVYSFVDTTYKIDLIQRKIGSFKEQISLASEDGEGIVELPIVWSRHAFVSCVPERVLLANKPMRVFLRCPDDNVGFTSISASPRGVVAKIESPHELSVALAKNTSNPDNGLIRIGTSDPDHPELTIPVLIAQEPAQIDH